MVFLGLRASLLAGIITVALFELPIMIRAMDEVVRMVPAELEEAAHSLGATRFEIATRVVLRQALPGLITGLLARIRPGDRRRGFRAIHGWVYRQYPSFAGRPRGDTAAGHLLSARNSIRGGSAARLCVGADTHHSRSSDERSCQNYGREIWRGTHGSSN